MWWPGWISTHSANVSSSTTWIVTSTQNIWETLEPISCSWTTMKKKSARQHLIRTYSRLFVCLRSSLLLDIVPSPFRLGILGKSRAKRRAHVRMSYVYWMGEILVFRAPRFECDKLFSSGGKRWSSFHIIFWRYSPGLSIEPAVSIRRNDDWSPSFHYWQHSQHFLVDLFLMRWAEKILPREYDFPFQGTECTCYEHILAIKGSDRFTFK